MATNNPLTMSQSQFTRPPPPVPSVLTTFPAPHTLLITLNRPESLNAIPSPNHALMSDLLTWYESEPSLRVAIITGTGRAFCAGADLKEWHERNNTPEVRAAIAAGKPQPRNTMWTRAGFGGISNRPGKKPIIAAVNGLCLGGGFEMAINCDMIVAEEHAKFGFPEVKVGVVAVAGALPRIVRIVGKQRAAEMVLTGRNFSAKEMETWGIVNRIVGKGDAVKGALELAEAVVACSPDAVIVSREGMRLGLEGIGPELGTEIVENGIYKTMDGGVNMKEGVLSFIERRKAKWIDSKL